MIYIEADLDYIFIRAQDKNDKWINLSLNDITDVQFVDWIKDRFKLDTEDADDQVGKPWNPAQKIDILNYISRNICDGKDCVVMIAREARDEWSKEKKNVK